MYFDFSTDFGVLQLPPVVALSVRRFRAAQCADAGRLKEIMLKQLIVQPSEEKMQQKKVNVGEFVVPW
jgi:hypothetical protein